ncbi:MAG: DUF47 family protein [Clostridia bacterium]|nr:DUF47 family protein [Clostridia bacterium]
MDNLLDRVFPPKYDFYAMLNQQARLNAQGVEALFNWLRDASAMESSALQQEFKVADEIRMDLEQKLVDAFTTPFDRGDIYSISIGMNKVIEYAESTLLSMQAYDMAANPVIIGMVAILKEGTDQFAAAVSCLKADPVQTESFIARIRQTHDRIEQQYRDAMSAVFKSQDPMEALRQREVYHHIKDASAYLDSAVDVLHKIVVRLT